MAHGSGEFRLEEMMSATIASRYHRAQFYRSDPYMRGEVMRLRPSPVDIGGVMHGG